MKANMISVRVRALGWLLAVLALSQGGCRVLDDHAADKVPQYGIIDPNQPHELAMVSMPPHVLEPPDEIEITARPAALEVPTTTVVVQADGFIDLGFHGEVYVAGLTLAEAELKLGQHLAEFVGRQKLPVREPIEISVRLDNSVQSKSYYVLGSVATQGKFPVNGNITVMDAILQAGLRTNSLPEKAYLVRPHPVGTPDQVLLIDWCGIRDRGDTLTNYQVFPGDRIIVPGGKPAGLLGTLFGGG